MLGPVSVLEDPADKLGVIAGLGPEVEDTEGWLSVALIGGRDRCAGDSMLGEKLVVVRAPMGLAGKLALAGMAEVEVARKDCANG